MIWEEVWSIRAEEDEALESDSSSSVTSLNPELAVTCFISLNLCFTNFRHPLKIAPTQSYHESKASLRVFRFPFPSLLVL